MMATSLKTMALLGDAQGDDDGALDKRPSPYNSLKNKLLDEGDEGDAGSLSLSTNEIPRAEAGMERGSGRSQGL